MKTLRIDNRPQMVFVLKETDTSIVYIPVKSLTRTDYDRLIEIEKQGGEMLAEMRKTKLENGRNALALYDSLIQVVRLNDKTSGTRLRKPDEPQAIGSEPAQSTTETQEKEEQKPKPRGRKPKANNTTQDE